MDYTAKTHNITSDLRVSQLVHSIESMDSAIKTSCDIGAMYSAAETPYFVLELWILQLLF